MNPDHMLRFLEALDSVLPRPSFRLAALMVYLDSKGADGVITIGDAAELVRCTPPAMSSAVAQAASASVLSRVGLRDGRKTGVALGPKGREIMQEVNR